LQVPVAYELLVKPVGAFQNYSGWGGNALSGFTFTGPNGTSDLHGNNSNNNKHVYAGTSDCFTHLRALLVLQAPRHWPYLASAADGQSCPSGVIPVLKAGESTRVKYGIKCSPLTPLRTELVFDLQVWYLTPS
jgi:hypothetical protein